MQLPKNTVIPQVSNTATPYVQVIKKCACTLSCRTVLKKEKAAPGPKAKAKGAPAKPVRESGDAGPSKRKVPKGDGTGRSKKPRPAK